MTRSESPEPAGRHVKRKHGLTRSKNGCLTCRKRRKKCDGESPICTHCSRLGLECEWPSAKQVNQKQTKPRARRGIKESSALRQVSSGASSSPAGIEALELYVSQERPSKDMEIHQAAQVLFAQRDVDFHGMQDIPSPYSGILATNPDLDNDHHAGPTQEDLQAAQWLSGYRGDIHAYTSNALSAVGNILAVPASQDNYPFCSEPTFGSANALSYSSSPEEERRFFLHKSPFEHVDHDTRILLDYFETEFAQLISVAPRASNNLLRVFLPMAVENDAMRAAIAGWSATHLRDIDDRFTSQSLRYMGIAADALEVAISDPKECDKDMTLALALIICAVEVCKDTDSRWVKYRRIAHDIIKRRDLVNSYGGRDQIFLLKNFAYHDVMSSCPPGQSTIPQIESQIILNSIPNLGGPDCYMGIATSLYSIISETTVMAARIRMEKWDQRRIATHASRLIVMIDNTEPRPSDLQHLKRGQELRQNLAMFKILQLTAKLYINQTLLKYNARSIGSQVLIQAVMPLFGNLQTVLVEMLFPLFVVGVDSLGEDRNKVQRMLEIMHEKFRIGNVRCAHAVLQKCWESNVYGEEYVDWNMAAYNLFDQCISLA